MISPFHNVIAILSGCCESRDFILCNCKTPKPPPIHNLYRGPKRRVNDNQHHVMPNNTPAYLFTLEKHAQDCGSQMFQGYCRFYLAILNCEPPILFFALSGIPTPTALRLFLLMPSSLAFNCSWIFLFCAQSSANFCIRNAAMTARAADLSVGRRSWIVTSGVMPICEMRFRSCWLLHKH